MSLQTTMRALQQTALDGPQSLQLVSDAVVPEPGPGEVLVRVTAAGINFVDIARAHGTFGHNPRPPFVAGFEAVGEVVALGRAVTSPALGARVFGAGAGAFAEYVVMSAAAAAPVPPGWADEQVLGLAINWPTALAALRLGRVAANETVLIHAAAGATGHAAVKIAKHLGARVIGVASATKHDQRRGVDVGDLLVELPLRQPDLADALELLFEVPIAQDRAAALHALVVHREALDGELLDDARGPLAELHPALGVDLVADGDDGREVVVLGVVGLAVGSSYSKISNNCFLLKLAVLERLFQAVGELMVNS